MNKRSKTLLSISVIYSLVFAGLLGNGLYLLSAEGARLEIAKTQISEHTAKEAAYTKMMSLLEATKDNRATLQEFFITEADTISFLATMESAAKKIGVELKTTELAVVPGSSKDGVTTLPLLSISFSFAGSETAVKTFLELLEHIPYHAVMPKVTLTSGSADSVWTGAAQLRLTLQP